MQIKLIKYGQVSTMPINMTLISQHLIAQ